jgi:hypothetical protein
VVKYGKGLVISFNIFLDPKYHQAKVVGDETTFSSLSIGLGNII